MEELRTAWVAADGVEEPYGQFFQWLLLTAWRKSEARHLQWNWVNWKDGTVTIPAAHSKDKKDHTHPLSMKMREMLKARGPGIGQGYRLHVQREWPSSTG
jgi:integrase